MSPDESLQRLEERIAGVRGRGELTPAAGLAAMLAFFREVRAEGCADHDGDMLLYQWGTYDWGEGEGFELDLIRQFTGTGAEDEDISQLSLKYIFAPDPRLRSVGQGNRWCRHASDVQAFQEAVVASPAYALVSGRKDASVEVRYAYV